MTLVWAKCGVMLNPRSICTLIYLDFKRKVHMLKIYHFSCEDVCCSQISPGHKFFVWGLLAVVMPHKVTLCLLISVLYTPNTVGGASFGCFGWFAL